ncbi:MAG: transcriptional regulator, LuxR family [Sphingomonas bacterium]|nr:helix-turn-helix transcriptional regulator [Sphingomonas bacterium]MDB5690632.1 transcriptional regulator, LuxR family [Sphingomonas bacterium]
MIDPASVDAIASASYVAAIEDDGWQRWLAELAGSIGSAGGIFAVLDRQSLALDYSVQLADNQAGIDEYRAEMWRRDPYAHHFAAFGSGPPELRTNNELPIIRNASADYRAWQEDRFGFHSSIVLTGRLDEHHAAGFCLHFRREHADRAHAARAALASATGAIFQAIQLGMRHRQLLQESYWRGLDAVVDGRAAFLLGERGKVIRMNQAAEALVARRAGIALRGGELACARGDRGTLRALIHHAVHEERGGTILVAGPDGEPALSATIYPIPRRMRPMVSHEPMAMLTLRPIRCAAPVSPLWRGAFGLTSAEARVAEQLSEGMADRAVADRLNVEVSTVRSHVKAIRAKTETRSKGELVALLARLAGS